MEFELEGYALPIPESRWGKVAGPGRRSVAYPVVDLLEPGMSMAVAMSEFALRAMLYRYRHSRGTGRSFKVRPIADRRGWCRVWRVT